MTLARGLVLSVANQMGGPTPLTTLVKDFSRQSNNGTPTDLAWTRLPDGNWVMRMDGQTSSVSFSVKRVQSIGFWLYPEVLNRTILSIDAKTVSVDTSGNVTANGWAPSIYIDGIAGKTLQRGQWNYISIVNATVINTVEIVIPASLSGFVSKLKVWQIPLSLSTIRSNIVEKLSRPEMTWNYSNSYTIDRTGTTETLTDFPVLIKLDSTIPEQAAIIASCQANGQDIRFFSANGTLLSYELDTWNPAGDCLIHVKLPSLPLNSITTFYVKYGNPSAPDGQNATDVWSNNYVAVYHMNDLTTSTILDSVGVNNGTKKAANEPLEAAGLVGKAQSFDGTDDYVATTNSLTTDNDITYEILYKQASITSGRKGLSMANLRFGFDINNAAPQFGFRTALGVIQLTGDNQVAGTQYCLSGVYEPDGAGNAAITLYQNGVYKSDTSGAVTATQTVSPIRIGDRYVLGGTANLYFDGTFDEIRLSSVARSAEEVAATSLTLNTPNSFAVLGV